MSTVTLESLKYAILSVGLNEPWPIAIWFVNRHIEYIDVLSKCPTEIEHPSGTVRIYGVPLFTLNSQGGVKRNLLRPEFCSTPGVWLEMSNGLHVQLDKEETDAQEGP